MKITNNISLVRDGKDTCRLERVVTRNKRDPKTKELTDETYEDTETIGFYGTVYQALIYILRNNYDLEVSNSIFEQLEANVKAIEEAEEEIKSKFRTEVLVERYI